MGGRCNLVAEMLSNQTLRNSGGGDTFIEITGKAQ